ncbi:MAG: hypothetical protein ABIS07_14815, partial [Dokdonella sp.]
MPLQSFPSSCNDATSNHCGHPMAESMNYAVFLFPQAIEALGEPIKPYLREGPGGQHIVCAEIDASGALFGMTLAGKGPNSESLEL